jgi:hypothetical protein
MNDNIGEYSPESYGCEILLQNTTLDKAKDTSFPNEAYRPCKRIES